MTENQLRVMRLAMQHPDDWTLLDGLCMAGRFTGRGRSTVIRSLVKAGFIETRIRNIGILTPSYKECVRVTDKGCKAYESIMAEQSEKKL